MTEEEARKLKPGDLVMYIARRESNSFTPGRVYKIRRSAKDIMFNLIKVEKDDFGMENGFHHRHFKKITKESRELAELLFL